MLVRSTAAWAQVVYAALESEALSTPSAFQVHCAVIMATEAAIRNAATNIQNHGGIGFTGEHHPHLYLKRAHVLDIVLGGLTTRRVRLLKEPAPQ